MQLHLVRRRARQSFSQPQGFFPGQEAASAKTFKDLPSCSIFPLKEIPSSAPVGPQKLLPRAFVGTTRAAVEVLVSTSSTMLTLDFRTSDFGKFDYRAHVHNVDDPTQAARLTSPDNGKKCALWSGGAGG